MADIGDEREWHVYQDETGRYHIAFRHVEDTLMDRLDRLGDWIHAAATLDD